MQARFPERGETPLLQTRPNAFVRVKREVEAPAETSHPFPSPLVPRDPPGGRVGFKHKTPANVSVAWILSLARLACILRMTSLFLLEANVYHGAQ